LDERADYIDEDAEEEAEASEEVGDGLAEPIEEEPDDAKENIGGQAEESERCAYAEHPHREVDRDVPFLWAFRFAMDLGKQIRIKTKLALR